MNHDAPNGEKKEIVASPEEMRLKQGLDQTRAAYAMAYRRVEAGSTGINPIRLTNKREEQMRKDEPLGDLASTWNAYHNARTTYFIEIRQTRGDLAERRAQAHEAEELIRDKRRLRFMAAFGRALSISKTFAKFAQGVMSGVEYVKKNPAEAALLTGLILTLGTAAVIAALPAAVLAAWAPFFGGAAAGIAVGVPTFFSLALLREWAANKYREYLVKEGSLTPEDIGARMAEIQRGSKVGAFLLSLGLGFSVRSMARNALAGVDWVGVKTGFSESTSIEAKAATLPKAPPTGPEGVITPDEQTFIDRVLEPYEDIANKYRGDIAALERQRGSYIAKAMAQGQPRAQAEFNFDQNLQLLRGTAAEYDAAIRGARGQMELVARRAFDPRYPNMLADEARLRVDGIQEAKERLSGHYAFFAEVVRTGKPPQYVEGALQPTDKSRFQQLSYDARSPEDLTPGASDPLYELIPVNVREYFTKLVSDLYESTNWKSATLEQEIMRLEAIDRAALPPDTAVRLAETIQSMRRVLAAYDSSFNEVNDTAYNFSREAVDSKNGEAWLPSNKARVDAALTPRVEACKTAGDECIASAVKARADFPAEQFPSSRPRGMKLGYENPESASDIRIGNAESAAAIANVDKSLLQPALDRASALGSAYEALSSNPPPVDTPEYTKWYALMSKMEDAFRDYDDLLHRIARLQHHIADLSFKNPKATATELLEMARADYELGGSTELGLDRLEELDNAVRAKGDALVENAKKLGVIAGVETTVNAPSLVELTKLTTDLASYIDSQAIAFKRMADGLAHILTAKPSIATFKNMMTTEVLAFGKLAPKVQMDLDHVVELARSGRATDAEIAAAYAKADAGLVELDRHSGAAAEHYYRATNEVDQSLSEGGIQEIGYDDISSITTVQDFQENMSWRSRTALNRLFSALQQYEGRTDTSSINSKARILSAIEDVKDAIENNKRILDGGGDSELMSADKGPGLLRELARKSSDFIDRRLRDILGTPGRPTIA